MAHRSKNKAKRKTSAWFQRHVRDAYVRRAQREGKRSRAAFKLTEILDRQALELKPDAVVVDLGCAPGSWSVEIERRLGPEGLLVGIDLLPVAPIGRAIIIQDDFNSPEAQAKLEEALNGRRVDLVLSDMAPEMSGNKLVDQMRILELNEMTLRFAKRNLKSGGDLLMKTFMGAGYEELRRKMRDCFTSVKNIKPAASRKASAEFFMLGRGFKGCASQEE